MGANFFRSCIQNFSTSNVQKNPVANGGKVAQKTEKRITPIFDDIF
jgi:hypothetical protein